MSAGINSSAVTEEFMEHAREEQAHADLLAGRIKQLGGKPELHPSVIAERSHSEYREGTSLATNMIREDLIAEHIAIETYREMVRYFGDKDTTSESC
jgi:bacterioferritin